MFTGIIDHKGTVKERRTLEQGVELIIETRFAPLQEGESIGVDGVCLTALDAGERPLRVEVSPETLSKTSLTKVRPGDTVNLERALRLGDAMGGHWVTGHVDCTASVKEIRQEGAFRTIIFGGFSDALSRWLIPKGSIAVNGVSLTLNHVAPGEFSVMLIPHTLEKTNLEQLDKLSQVNIEFDWMVKTVLRDFGQRMTWMEEANAQIRPHS